jgi:hypothetical protein
LARVARLAGTESTDDGKTMVRKVGLAIGEEVGEERRTKVGEFWDRMQEHGSWKKVYGSGLY